MTMSCSPTTLRCDEFEIKQVKESDIRVFKLIGTEDTLDEYFRKCRSTQIENSERSRSDWSAFYMQLNEAHCLSTVNDRFESGYAYATSMQASLLTKDMTLYVVDDTKSGYIMDASIQGEEKAAKLKQILGIAKDELLMDALGERRSVLIMRETNDEWEVIIPEQLILDGCSFFTDIQKLAFYKAGKCIMLGFRSEDVNIDENKRWSRFDDGDVRNMSNKMPNWINRYVS